MVSSRALRTAAIGRRLATAAILAATTPTCAPVDDEAPVPSSEAFDQMVGLPRSEAISRAEQWVSARLHYCQSPNHARDYDSACSTYCNRTDNAQWNPYRSDCSGLVSWSWRLPAPGRVTWDFAPYQNDITHAISASSLQAGDAVNNRDHVMLFKRWDTPNEVATFIEEPGCSSSTPYAHEFTSRVHVSGSTISVDWNGMTFTAIRYNHITDGAGPTTEHVPPAPAHRCGEIDANEGLGPGASTRSCDGHHELVMQTDGNLVLYHDGRATWASGTYHAGGYALWMQADGNAVVYDRAAAPLWAAGTFGHGGAHLAVQDDGNLVVYAGSRPLWASNTDGR